MGKVVGIDLGTTNSLVAYVRDGVPVVIRDAAGDPLVPSVVSFAADGQIFVGREAQRRLLTEPSRTVYSVKRFMGRGIEDIANDASHLPFTVAGDPGGAIRIGVSGREFTPPEISAFVLRELKRRAEEHFRDQGEFDFEVDRAVITVPAYFNDAQRKATRDAGKIAGLEVLRIINEPTAASLAYGLDKRNRGTVAVYDLGGGTFDISILRIEDGVFEVLSTNGDTRLGGDDIDDVLVQFMWRELQRAGLDVQALLAAMREFRVTPKTTSANVVQAAPERLLSFSASLTKAVIQAKWDLSDQDETEIRIEASEVLPAGYRRRMTRSEFESLIHPLVDRTLEPVRQALADASLLPKDIDEAVLVGGSTRIPLVRRQVEGLFGRRPHSDLNPDEVVALGAAVQADILVSGRREMLLLDVTPLSLGIETMGGVVSKIILRNSTIPASGREMFTTGVDNQTSVDVHVLQGERELAADCRSLARFKLRGIPPMPAGLPRIEVRFQIDADGILTVSATELRTGIEQQIEVKPSYGLTDQEVERMLLEGFEHAEADFDTRLLIEARNEADQVVTATEKHLRRTDFGDIEQQLLPGELQRIDETLQALKDAISGSDRELIQQRTHALNHATQHLAEVTMNRSIREALTGRNVKEM
ncbi:MAG TPA: Fe-S protein assembly chaperone HscA [Vicinamibacterales bacterium]|nr:Fe-S protein assembly chaperone HscA [Vicinamibacterales bacterium]